MLDTSDTGANVPDAERRRQIARVTLTALDLVELRMDEESNMPRDEFLLKWLCRC